MTRTLIFVTGNANKLKEVRAILELHDIQVESKELDIVEIQGTTKEVSFAKCRQAAAQIGGPVITEDTALAFHAMNGLPGPYIKDFMKNLGHSGLNAMLAGFPDKGATAICTFAYSAGPGFDPILFEGAVEGEIVPARGSAHFGWDAVFQAAGTGQTFAEMDEKFKNGISHRYKALSKLVEYLKANPEGLDK